MDACSQTPAPRAPCATGVTGRRVERWMWLEEDAESLRARATGRLHFGALTGAQTQGDPWLADGLGVLDAVDDLVAAMIDADDVGFSRGCEALFRSVVGTRCLAALATRRLARVVNSRWFPVLMQVTPRRRLLGMRVLALHRTLAGMVPDGARPPAG
jgi:hypothetical protein